MLKIGEFSRLSQVTVKTLHHYDEIGLLVPAHIDKFTNHRYYAVEQLLRIHRIMALKGLGLSLEQIKLILEERLDTQEIRGLLRLKQNELEQRVREEQEQLAQVEFRLRLLEIEESLPEIEVILKKIPPIHALTLRLSLTPDKLIPLGQEFEHALARNKVKLMGPPAEIRYAEAYEPDFEDVEFVLPVDDSQVEDIPLTTFGVLKVTTVPAVENAATFMHRGVHTRPVDEALLLLRRWVIANGYKLGNTNRAVHHRGPVDHAEYADWITEIVHEIA